MKILLYILIPIILWSQDAEIVIKSYCWASLHNPIKPLVTERSFDITILHPDELAYKETSYSLVSDTYELNLTKEPLANSNKSTDYLKVK